MPANGEEIGTQAPIGIECSPVGGQASVVWISRCEGVTEFANNAFIPFAPENCPDDGVYVQKFTSDGQASGDRQHLAATTFSASSFYGRAAMLREGGILLAAAGHYLRVDAGGVLANVGEGEIGSFGEAALDCGAGIGRCVATSWAPLQVNTLDGDSPHRTSTTLLLEDVVEEPSAGPDYNRTTVGPAVAATACDLDGLCIGVWARERVSYSSDYESSEPLNIVAQAFDAYSGEVGQLVELFEGDWVSESAPAITNVAPGNFVLALRKDASTISLNLIGVE